MAGETIIVADDDAHIRDVVCFALKKAGFVTLTAENGQQALELVEDSQPDLIILDILMPVLDGTETCRRLRTTSEIPVIFLTSRDDEIDRIVGLEIGADDYMAKPFSPRELVARVKAILRRMERKPCSPASSGELRHNGLSMSRNSFEVLLHGRQIHLTAIEFDILEVLLKSPRQVFNRDQLMSAGQNEGNIIADRTIDSHIRKIRHKFKPLGIDPVETVRGVGYRLGTWN